MSLRRSGLLVIAALATAPAAARAQQGDAPPVGRLAAKYNLVERFTTQESRPGYVGQYQVAFREKYTSSEQGGYTRTIQFSERPASVPDDRRPSDVVRHYDSFTTEPPVVEKGGRHLLDDLTIWCREVPGRPPLVISLTPNRPLHEKEYNFAVTNNYVSKLTLILPATPVRLADTWRVSTGGTFALTTLSDLETGELVATLSDVRPHPGGNGQQAVINVTGHLAQNPREYGDNETSFSAEILFAFTPSAPLAAGDANLVDAFGAIEKLRLTQVTNSFNPDAVPPMKKERWLKRELVLDRRFPGKDATLTIPEPPPTATVENSWLTATTPGGEFHVRHPQEYEVKPGPPRPKADQGMPRLRLDYTDAKGALFVLTFDYYKTNVPPQAVFDQLKAEWSQKKLVVIPAGLPARLPDADWPGMAVHRMEVALTEPDAKPDIQVGRRYSDNYVIQFTRAGTIVATGNTFSDKHDEFRRQVESVLKTLKLGPPPS